MNDTDQFSDQAILAKTAWGEARSLGSEGMQATINTAQNRLASGVTWWGNSLRTICLYPWQYSSWNANDPNRPKLLSVTETDPQYAIALGLASEAIDGTLDDITHSATNYFDRRLPKEPTWALGKAPCFVLEPHIYFRIT